MLARVKISASVDSDAYWIPSDGILGIESAIEECLDGLEIKRIEVKLYGNI